MLEQVFDPAARRVETAAEQLVAVFQRHQLLTQAHVLLTQGPVGFQELREFGLQGFEFLQHGGTIIGAFLPRQPKSGLPTTVTAPHSIPPQRTPYRGRFAPTPSGPLHFGSLVAALASYLDARAAAGEWLVRIEDLDPPRVVAGADDNILRTLAAFGFEWQGAVLRQGQRGAAYAGALAELTRQGAVYGCDCSRRVLAEQARAGVDGPVYPGTCRRRGLGAEHALRWRSPPLRIHFDDAEQGRVGCNLAEECGDFVLRRADGVYSYQLAVVVDDAEQGISHVVRGADLLASTPRQIALQAALGLATPHYRHVPVVLGDDGAKLSKQTLAAPLDPRRPLPALCRAAAFLGLTPPAELDLRDFWAWATPAWRDRAPSPIRARRLPASLCNP